VWESKEPQDPPRSGHDHHRPPGHRPDRHDSADLLDLVILGITFEVCELCGLDAAELFNRIDNRDGADVLVCGTAPTPPTSAPATTSTPDPATTRDHQTARSLR